VAVSVRSSSNSGAGAVGTAVSVSAPAGTTTGDVVIVIVHSNGQTTIIDNNGGTPFTEDLNDYKPNTTEGHTLSVFSRRIQGGDPSTYNFTLGGTNRYAVVAVCFTGVDASSIYDVGIATENVGGSSGSITVDDITTLTDGSAHLIAAGWDTAAGSSFTYPSGYTNTSSRTTNQPLAVCYKIISPAGATGAQQLSNSEFGARVGISCAIKAASSTGVKEISNVARASVKEFSNVALASIKKVAGVTN